ncbi:SUF system Fe-S cluster assembly protein [Alkalicaulis satelles]|uniref:SUF system Fe-S cluster assembly protein n=1 Tax=Alkalicaulis satelles TaxID=2609175 RepID=A0A5M6ZHZ5_9PROT|nr:SUF system Fe-S cluster assembly protein [Alkalicaulis satelles]KAA5804452.1 SUF system Fe-S cluster assembly protein [Alkalicaulis satelles]
MDTGAAAPRDIINLTAQAEAPGVDAPAQAVTTSNDPDLPPGEIARITDDVIAALKSVHDPEIPADIYELGLIYQVDLEAEGVLKVEMTLTAPGCPVAGEMPGWVKDACEGVEGVTRADVTLTFDPPWTPARMSDEARLSLNML